MCEHFRFHPSAAFKRIDRLNNKVVNSFDIASFLKDNNYMNYFSVDMIDLIKAYDSDNDGQLTENDL